MEAGKLRLDAARDLLASSIRPSSAIASAGAGPSRDPAAAHQFRGCGWSRMAPDPVAFVAIDQNETMRPRRPSFLA